MTLYRTTFTVVARSYLVGVLVFSTHRGSRDRNREHARNTRIRKKQYVENLKLQIGEMLQAKAREERDIVLDQSRQAAAVRRLVHLVVCFLFSVERDTALNGRFAPCVANRSVFAVDSRCTQGDFNRLLINV